MFKYKKTIGGHVSAPEFEKYEAVATIPAGAALTLSGGSLSLCTTSVPTHISEGSGATGDMIACYAVMPGMIFEVPVTAIPVPVVGSKVTIDASALKVTTTTTNGVAIVVDQKGATKAGDKIYVKFS